MKKRGKAEPLMVWELLRGNKISIKYLFDTPAEAVIYRRSIKGDRIARINITEVWPKECEDI